MNGRRPEGGHQAPLTPRPLSATQRPIRRPAGRRPAGLRAGLWGAYWPFGPVCPWALGLRPNAQHLTHGSEAAMSNTFELAKPARTIKNVSQGFARPGQAAGLSAGKGLLMKVIGRRQPTNHLTLARICGSRGQMHGLALQSMICSQIRLK